MSSSARRLEQIAGLFILVILAVGCFVVLRPFLAALLWATILSISTWPAFRWLERRLLGRTTLAAAVMTLLLALALLVPIAILGTSLADNVARFSANVLGVFENGPPPPPPWVEDIPLLGAQLAEAWHYFSDDTAHFAATARDYVGPATQWLIGLGAKLGGGLLDLTLSVIAAFFFFRDGAYGAKRLKVMLEKVAGARGQRLLDVAETTVNGVVYGMLGTALAQGALAAFGLWIAGVPGALFLGLLTSLLSFVPMGPPMVWLPSAIWLFSSGDLEWGVFMGLWGFFVVSTVDNVIRPYFISIGSALPLLLVLLGVLGGIVAFGLLGVFIGPTMLAVGFTLIREWSHSKDLDGDPQAHDGKQALQGGDTPA
ncbi:MAG: AI-2E family transporter [Rhodospirillales bacterium]|nr:AI-2E family transporter [Rhodospirillales bacterium]